MMLCGLDSQDDSLNDKSAPTLQSIGRLKRQGLAVSANEKGALLFQKNWNMGQVDQWLQDLLPKPFQYLDTKWSIPEEEYHWVLIKIYRKRSLEKQVSRHPIPRKVTAMFEEKEPGVSGSEDGNDSDRHGKADSASGSLFSEDVVEDTVSPPSAQAGPSTSTRAASAAKEVACVDDNWMTCLDNEARVCNYGFKSPGQAVTNPWDCNTSESRMNLKTLTAESNMEARAKWRQQQKHKLLNMQPNLSTIP
ncbi:hypothetical protein K439DRAFT_1621058 [Ramaria rubella]|nr:hypothetical protein K439DRAFT_1621058 [Ramaria rubella]